MSWVGGWVGLQISFFDIITKQIVKQVQAGDREETKNLILSLISAVVVIESVPTGCQFVCKFPHSQSAWHKIDLILSPVSALYLYVFVDVHMCIC